MPARPCAHMHVESVLEEAELPGRIADDREELLVTRLLPAATAAGAVVVPGAVTLDPLRRNVELTGCPGQARPAGRRHVRAELDHRGARSRVRRRNDVSGGDPKFHPSASVTTVTGDLSGRRRERAIFASATFLPQR
jgi:hypothetical protein